MATSRRRAFFCALPGAAVASVAAKHLSPAGESSPDSDGAEPIAPEATAEPQNTLGRGTDHVSETELETRLEIICTTNSDDAFAAAVAELRAWCADAGIHVYDGDVVNGKAAAFLLGITEGAMRNWRCCYGEKIPSVKRGRRVYYELSALAAALLGISS